MATNAPYDAQASTNYKEAFALFDKRGNQRVQLECLGDLLRACGQNPTLSEIRDLEKNVGSDCTFPSLFPPLSQLHANSSFCPQFRVVVRRANG
jgi:Ca2+-binding EF-hand superfamily protein